LRPEGFARTSFFKTSGGALAGRARGCFPGIGYGKGETMKGKRNKTNS
jgi:hypothetical protein